jgi:hypothetical protein
MRAYLRFQLERWLQHGLFHQLVFLAGLVVLISVLGGLAAWVASDQFATPLAGIWWSFLRLTDPGYLGDDEGIALRVISTTVTVLGYVLFMGSLIAVLTQWLKETLTRFEEGLSTISMRGHVVIFGWTNRTPEIVLQLLAARGRLKRFLEAHGQRRLRIVVVADEVGAERRLRLHNYIGRARGRGQVFLRRGSATILGDLSRFDLARAAVVVIPGDEFRYAGAEASDARVVKSLLNLRHFFADNASGTRPQVVAEITDPDKEAAAARAYDGPVEIVPGDAVVARLLAQSMLDRRIAAVILELLTHNEGCSPFVRALPEFSGRHPFEIDTRRDRAIVIGALRGEGGQREACLNPPADFRLRDDDQVIFIAHAFEDCVPAGEATPRFEVVQPTDVAQLPELRLLILGWNSHLAQMVEDLLAAGVAHAHLTIVSRVPLSARAAWFVTRDLPVERVTFKHLAADILAAGTLEEFDLTTRDAVLVAATSLRESAEESDARVLTAYELLKFERREQCRDGAARPEIVLELSHPGSADHGMEPGDVVVTRPRLLGFLQSHVALRPALNPVFDEILLPAGSTRLAVRDGSGEAGGDYSALLRDARRAGDLPLGVVIDAGTEKERVVLCPKDDFRWRGRADLVVLTGAAASPATDPRQAPEVVSTGEASPVSS